MEEHERSATSGGSSWGALCAELDARPREELTGADLDRLADALFWLDRVDESIRVRGDAYRRHVGGGDDDHAARSSWRLFYDHFLVGERAAAFGWLERCRSHVGPGATVGWLAIADSDAAAAGGDEESAMDRASTAVEVARRLDDADLLAMALQAEGRAHVRRGDRAAGLRLLDEAMVGVAAGELDPLYTGWVYCNVVSTCYQIAELERAAEWSDASMRWCDTLADGRMYPGLCRVYSVELAALRGHWDRADREAERACAELTAFDPRYAGEAHYQLGELRRRRGDLDPAEEHFALANELGRTPQPGLALLVAHRTTPAEALAGLRTARAGFVGAPLPHALVLAELCMLAVEADDAAIAGTAATELRAVAAALPDGVVTALADGAQGRVAAAEGDHESGCRMLRSAADELAARRVPYESARLRLAASRVAAAIGDHVTARLDARSALAVFERLAAIDRTAATRWLRDLERGSGRTELDGEPRTRTPLTGREIEVLRLVAGGSTNRQIAAELYLSPHTVSRHLSNIFTKLDVNSRAAATAYAYEHHVVDGSA